MTLFNCNPYRMAWPILRHIDPERAHGLAISALKSGLIPTARSFDDPVLSCSLWGMDFSSPVGLAAGFDKNAEVWRALLDLGFGAVEVGSVTPRPQPGNPRPRLFRLESDRGVINRMGFNNDGFEAMAANLQGRLVGGKKRNGIVGVNLGKNKDSDDAQADYVKGVWRFAGLADYLVVNVSSPNTPGLRALQGREPLRALLGAVMGARTDAAQSNKLPVLLKIAPDLTDEDKSDIAAVVLETGVDGLIVSNTTLARPETLTSPYRTETGGLSGRPLFSSATALLGEMYRLTEAKIPLVGVGGVEDGRTAYAKIRAGASLVQFYSAMVYQGPGLVQKIKRELADLLKADGYSAVSQAVGADHR